MGWWYVSAVVRLANDSPQWRDCASPDDSNVNHARHFGLDLNLVLTRWGLAWRYSGVGRGVGVWGWILWG
jgi:hypothetical protein